MRYFGWTETEGGRDREMEGGGFKTTCDSPNPWSCLGCKGSLHGGCPFKVLLELVSYQMITWGWEGLACERDMLSIPLVNSTVALCGTCTAGRREYALHFA